MNRIVRLSFEEDKRQDFTKVFKKHQQSMKENFSECISLEAFEDKKQPGLFFTFSVWQEPASLEKYRDSEYFREIWGTIKPWFNEKAQAWSLDKV
jgi:quinol monooxygenase YgiN